MEKKEKQIKENLIYDGKIIKVYNDEVLCPNGQISTREIIKHRGGVCILGFLEDKIIIEKQFRYAYNDFVYELPAGKLEKGEKPLDAAIREFEEETGFKPISMVDLGCMYPTCGYTNEIIYLYYADKLEKGTKHLDFDENLDILYLTIDEINDMINKNIIKDAKTICLIHKYMSYKKITFIK